MLPEHRVLLGDEPCPVPDEILGEMYRASAHGLDQLIATVSPTARALLALYCYRRAHLASIGLTIAATCDKDDLSSFGGNAGAVLFERSREAPQSSSPDTHSSRRRRITLAEGPLRQLSPIDDEAAFLAAGGIA
jgi:hypothetical protein